MSSLKDLASLIMVPSLYKDGELHTVEPLADEDVILHPDATGNHDGNDGTTDRSSSNFTFSRGSNLAATRVASSGYIEKGRENLLLQSNTFSNATWTKAVSSVTSGQSGYDGSNDAWLLSATGNFARIQQSAGPTGVLTLSTYAKAGTTDWVMLRIAGAGYNVTQYFDLTNGVVGSISGISAKITSVGGGWYRCEATANALASASSYIYSALGDGNLSVTNETLYIQDAQIEQGLVATDYIETGASTAQAGILEDMPRLDYSGGASCPSLLLEPQRSNEILQSEYFDAWDQIRGGSVPTFPIVTNNYAISPEGVKNAARVQLDLDGNTTFNDYNLLRWTNMASAIRTYSVYMKSTDGVSTYDIAMRSDNVETFEVTGEWQRFDMTSNTAQTYIQIGLRGTWNTSDSADILIYAAQGEQASYPTSYIPTYGSSVTRSQDEADITSASTIIGSEGVMFIEMQGFENGGNSRRCTLSDGSNDNRVMIEFDEADNRIKGFVSESGTTTGVTASPYDHTNNNKVALKYTASEIKIFVNGVLGASDSLGGSPIGMDEIHLYQSSSSARWMEGFVKQFLIFPTALTDSECIALTE